MKVALIGGTGYVGSYICDELIANDHTPRILVREGSESKVIAPKKCELIKGDISEVLPMINYNLEGQSWRLILPLNLELNDFC